MPYTAPHHQRSRYENTTTMKSGDPDLQAGPMAKREDFKKTTRMLYSLWREQGKVNSFIPGDKWTRQGDKLYLTLQERLKWLSRHWREAFSTISTSATFIWTQNKWNNDKWQDDSWKENQRWRSEWMVFIMQLETVARTVKFWRRHQGWEMSKAETFLRVFRSQTIAIPEFTSHFGSSLELTTQEASCLRAPERIFSIT